MKIIYDLDIETPVSIQGDIVRADWYDAYEGLYGDYDPEDPNDIHLLRFDIYKMEDGDWVEVEDASYCTNIPFDTGRDVLVDKLRVIYEEYDDVLRSDPDASVKKLGEMLSWIGV